MLVQKTLIEIAAKKYHQRGWCPIPLRPGSKKPVEDDWQKTTREDQQVYRSNANIGVVLGRASGGLLDVDLDCDEAVTAAAALLPSTGARFGREGKATHWLYQSIEPDARTKTRKLVDPSIANRDEATVIELRADNSTGGGAQTMFPPSVHPDGDRVAWVETKKLARIPPETLWLHVRLVHAAVLLGRRLRPGMFHDGMLCVCGGLARAKVDSDLAEAFVRCVVDLAGQKDEKDRLRELNDTYRKYAKNEAIKGWTGLADCGVPVEVVRSLDKWLPGGASANRPDAMPTTWSGKPTVEHNVWTIANTIKAAIEVLNGNEAHHVYVHGTGLKYLVSLPEEQDREGVHRPKGAVILNSVDYPWLTYGLIDAVAWLSWDTEDCCWVCRPSPEAVIARSIIARPDTWWFPRLRGVIEAPAIALDGTLVEKPGYDPKTQLLLRPVGDVAFCAVKRRPTRADALAALRTLLRPVREYDWVSDRDKAIWVSAALTALMRRVLPTAPLFAFDAPRAGSGKTKLVFVISEVFLGRTPTVVTWSDDSENRKVIDTVLMQGDPIVLWDNVRSDQPIRGPKLEMTLTTESADARVLGESRVVSTPTNALFCATGNNLAFAGDMPRRVLKCRIDPGVENPADRVFDFDPVVWAREHRPVLHNAALTIAKAWHRAGMPEQQGAQPMGSFEVWARWCRDPLRWLGLPDIVTSSHELMTTDNEERANAFSVLEAWYRVFGSRAIYARDVSSASDARLARELSAVCEGAPEVLRFGAWLRDKRDKVVGPYRLERQNGRSGKAQWRVINTRVGAH